MELTFLGAAGEVTGSCTRVRHDSGSFIVDCGLFQGGRDARLKNVRVPDFDPKSIDFVLLTHAHLDHSGLIPRLIAFGYKGPVYTTRATADRKHPANPSCRFAQSQMAGCQRCGNNSPILL